MVKQLDLRIDGRYKLITRLGKGTFGLVYQGLDLRTNDDVAIKLEHCSIDPSMLDGEIRAYKELQGCRGIPQVYWAGSECEYNVMVFELLGPNLEDLFNYCGREFLLKTVLLLADQLLHRLQVLHANQVIHRDIKPENFLMGRNKKGNQVHVTDLGLAWSDFAATSKTSAGLIGTACYASINGHLGNEQSAFDDLESLGYMLIYFLSGSLPWQDLRVESHEELEGLILEEKQAISPAVLCDSLPTAFAEYMSYVSERKDEVPNYAKLRKGFKALFNQQGFKYDHVFDWTILKYLESHPG